MYRPLADTWQVIDNAIRDEPHLIAAGETLNRFTVLQPITLEQIAESSMTTPDDADWEPEILAKAEIVRAAIAAAVHDALLDHQRAGNPVPEWRNGKVVWIPPEEIFKGDSAH